MLPKLDLNITNRCNFRCVHCAFDSGKTRIPEFSLEKIRTILADTKKLGGKKIDITGGEPTLRKDIFRIIKIAKSMDYRIELVTNGSLLNKKILEKLKSLKLDSLAISLDGPDYETYSGIRKVSRKTYSTVLRTIKTAKKLGFIVKINTVVFSSNLSSIPKITEFCIKNRIDEHGLYYFTPVGRGSCNTEKSVEPLAWLSFIRKNLARFKGKIKISLETPLIEKNKLRGELGCIANAERYHLQILPNGNVFPCAILASYNRPVANLHKTAIPRIWQNNACWKKYWSSITPCFKNSSCVDFDSFRIKDYKGYTPVCPLRKFLLEDVL